MGAVTGTHSHTKFVSGRTPVAGIDPKLIVACQPTQGLDVGAAAYVHEQLLAARGRGMSRSGSPEPSFYVPPAG